MSNISKEQYESIKSFINENCPKPERAFNGYCKDFMQISTPLENDLEKVHNGFYIHYELIQEEIHLHLELAREPNEEEDFPDELKKIDDYLSRCIENRTPQHFKGKLKREDLRDLNMYGYKYRLNQPVNMDKPDIIKEFINLFDGFFDEYEELNSKSKNKTELGIDDCLEEQLKVSANNVSLYTMKLEKVLKLPLSIPEYQRIYCWEEWNVVCLLEDVFEHIENKIKSSDQDEKNYDDDYILGTIILHYHDGKYDIIDGQQRLITLSLLLSKLKVESNLMEENVTSKESIQYIKYNKYLIKLFREKKKWNDDDIKKKSKQLLDHITFSVLVLKNSSLDLAYTFFSNQNSRGVPLTDYDLLKAHHLRYIPQAFEQQATRASNEWNKMIEDGRIEKEKIVDYKTPLDTYIYRLRKWMRKKECEDDSKKYRIKQEYEAAAIIDEIPPFGEKFFFNEPIQGGTHFFEYVKQHLKRYEDFCKTKEYDVLHKEMAGGSFQFYRDVIEALLFEYYMKFGTSYLSDAMAVIMRRILQHRYEKDRAYKDSVVKYAGNTDFALMIDQATSPTFFLAEARNAVKNLSILTDDKSKLTPIQAKMKEKACCIAGAINISIKSFKEFNK